MSKDNNNGLFDNVKRTMNNSQTKEHGDGSSFAFEQMSDNDIQAVVNQKLSLEKKRLVAELQDKFKNASVEQMHQHEGKIRQVFEQEKDRYQKQLKEKYEGIAKSLLQQREQQLVKRFNQELNKVKDSATEKVQLSTREWQVLEARLKQEMQQQKMAFQTELENAKTTVGKEQENIARTLYGDMLKNKCAEIARHEQHKYTQLLKEREAEFADEFNKQIHEREQEFANKLNAQIKEIAADYELRLNKSIAEKVQELKRTYAVNLSREKSRLVKMHSQEMSNAVAKNTQKLQAKYKHEIDELKMQNELAQKQAQLVIATTRQKVLEELERENSIVLKYKERELSEDNEAKLALAKIKLAQENEQHIKKLLTDQKNTIETEYNEKLEKAKKDASIREEVFQLQQETLLQQHNEKIEGLTNKLQHDHERGLHIAIEEAMLEREQELKHKFDLELIQVQQQLIEMFDTSKQTELDHQEQMLREHMAVELEKYKEQLRASQEHNVLSPEVTAVMPYDLDEIYAKFASEKQDALEQQYANLSEKFSNALRDARTEWEKDRSTKLDTNVNAEVSNREQQMRREFQAKLEDQRKHDSALMARQSEQEMHRLLAVYKQKLTDELAGAKATKIAAEEQVLKELYDSKLEKHIETIKVQLHQQQEIKLQEVAAQQKAFLQQDYDRKIAQLDYEHEKKYAQQLEQERKKINLKFAQDKADLIQDITARFNQEKQNAIEQYENELRDTLYKEMVKQKEYIQTKFASGQEAALQEQKRRLESQHKHEIEKIKQGYFATRDPAEFNRTVVHTRSAHGPVIIERGVEQLADRILAKFQPRPVNTAED